MPFKNYGLNWSWHPALKKTGMWGSRARGSNPVDFQHQIGIYLLQKGREFVYVGKSATGPTAGILGRLTGHTYDDKKGKWDTFSWFGVRDVSSGGGGLEKTPIINMDTARLIGDIEAVLIHALDLKLNLASGAHKHIIAYNQLWPPKY